MKTEKLSNHGLSFALSRRFLVKLIKGLVLGMTSWQLNHGLWVTFIYSTFIVTAAQIV